MTAAADTIEMLPPDKQCAYTPTIRKAVIKATLHMVATCAKQHEHCCMHVSHKLHCTSTVTRNTIHCAPLSYTLACDSQLACRLGRQGNCHQKQLMQVSNTSFTLNKALLQARH